MLAALDGLVVDLRSGSYAALAPVPGAVTVQVLSERPDGTRTVVSHFNKAHKGRLARLLRHDDRRAGRRRATPGAAEAGGVARGT